MAWTWHSRSTAAGAPGTLFALIEGTAAGAMLAVAAETMLLEVFPRGAGPSTSRPPGFLGSQLPKSGKIFPSPSSRLIIRRQVVTQTPEIETLFFRIQDLDLGTLVALNSATTGRGTFMLSRVSLVVVLLVVLGFASNAIAGTILGCGADGSACGISVSIDGTQVATGSYEIDPETGALSLSSPVGGSVGSSNVMVDNISGNADPILGFGIGSSTGATGNSFSITLTLPIALSGPINANSSINYTLTSLTGAGAQLAPLFGTTLIAQEVDSSIGGLAPLNKGVDVGGTFFFVGGPATNPSPVYTASSVLTGDLQYDLMSVTIAYTLSPNTTAGLSGFVQQVPVPEPSTAMLLALGLVVLARRRSL
jgi:hypothetical protein